MRWSMEIKELQPQPVLRIQSRVAPQRLDEFLMEAFTRLFPFLASLGEHPAGPPFIVYYDSVAQGGIDVEVCIPTLTVLPVPPDDDDIVPAELPGGDFATTVHVGPSDNIGEAYRALVLCVPHPVPWTPLCGSCGRLNFPLVLGLTRLARA